MEAPSSENILLIDIDGNQSHDDLLTYIHAKKEEDAPIRRLLCSIHAPHDEELGMQHPLFTVVQGTTTLQHVEFRSFGGNACIDAFLDAISQNTSIHTVDLFKIDCSAHDVQKLMERNIKLEFQGCRVIGHPSIINHSTCNIGELSIQQNDLSVIDFILSFRSWPLLRWLSITGKMGMPLDLQLVHLIEHIIRGAPILHELALHNFLFHDPAVLQSVAAMMVDNNSSSPRHLKWHLNYCDFHPNTIRIWEDIIKREKAKLIRVSLRLDKDHCGVFRTMMSKSSCLGELDVTDECCDRILEILPLLQQHPFTSAYPHISIHLTIKTSYLKRYRKVMESIPSWSPRVQKLFIYESYGRTSRPLFHMKLLNAVRSNLHLKSVRLEVKNIMDFNDEKTKNADERCCARLEQYCERNQKLQVLDEAETIPLNIWPYVYHLACRGGSNLLYQCLRENLGYTLS